MKYNKDYTDYILSKEWQTKRKQAFKMFGKKCQRCGISRKLHVHHKTYERFKDENVNTDLAILCDKCHVLYHKKVKKTTIQLTDKFILDVKSVKKLKFKKPKKKDKKKFNSFDFKKFRLDREAEKDEVYLFMKEIGLIK